MNLFRLSKNVLEFVGKSMKRWNKELTAVLKGLEVSI